MHKFWSHFTRHAILASGKISGATSNGFSCTARFTQIFNGRIEYELEVEENNQQRISRWIEQSNKFCFEGETEQGQSIRLENLKPIHCTYDLGELWVLRGWLPRSKPLYVGNYDNSQNISLAVIHVTNLPLYQEPCFSLEVKNMALTFSRIQDYKEMHRVASGIKAACVFSQIVIRHEGKVTVDEIDSFIRSLCGSISIAQRSHVWPVHVKYFDDNEDLCISKFQEPVFDIPKSMRPLIPDASLAKFLVSSVSKDHSLYTEWNLSSAQDFYIQAVALNSAWSKAVGFFTALESIKSGFVNQPGNEKIERYVGKNEFKKKKIANKVMQIVADNFDEFKIYVDSALQEGVSDDERAQHRVERDTLKSRVGELNRRAYKQILRKMFAALNVEVEDEELKKLVDLRNQIIHNGSPEYENSNLWTEPSEAFYWARRFARLVERCILAVTKYEGPVNTYDE